MGNDILFSDSRIEKAILDHKFVALIEVTNGITNPKKRQEKKKQVKKGKKIIERAFGDEILVSGGLALIKNNQKDIKELDFSIEINDYHLGFLYQVIDQLLETDYLNPQDRFYLKTFSNCPRTIVEKLNPPSYLIKDFCKSYLNRLSHIKGAVLEHYVAGLLKKNLGTNYDLSIGTEITDLKSSRNQTVLTDILLACSPGLFKESLEKLTELYSGKQRIKVNFPEIVKAEHQERNIRLPYSHSFLCRS